MPYLISEHPKYCHRYYYNAMIEYVPSYYIGLSEEQKAAQRAVWDFKEGKYTKDQMEWFANMVNWRCYKFNERVVTFMPSTDRDTHIKRWARLAEYLQENTKCKVMLEGLAHHGWDLRPKHQAGKRGKEHLSVGVNPWEFDGMGAVVIDDVLNTGESFLRTADAMKWADIRSVYGLFFAKTVKPDLPVKDSFGKRRL